ncbi:putative mitochondrial carrier protein rim2 [Kockovaella imperatae]|uniref:Putative mitochondrial carrier protein rim2 n=1 Tax=Kockovaella imperatae TaxID=4999 RepID=A0A1Y1U8Z4_9TREE|nr:putative mitochondrial carrier protein rim2 [Kockovaella imperatae]ORX33966.1 putative mitochondrial carrier protein rim2 [Kockovaella imperatae]
MFGPSSSSDAGPSRTPLVPAASPRSDVPPSTASPPQRQKLSGWKHSAAGSLGGMAGAIVTSPFDVVKTRLQSDMFRHQAATSPTTVKRSSGGLYQFVDTILLIRRIGVEEGWRALYKGLGPALVGIIPARAINFYFYPTSKQFLAQRFPNAPTTSKGQTAEDSPVIHLGAAVIAGIMTATGTNPIWVIKTRLQLSARKRPTSTPVSTSPLPRPIANSAASLTQTASIASPSNFGAALSLTRDIFRREGIRGLYRGLSASYLGVSEGVIQWVLYERFKRIGTGTSITDAPRETTALSWIGSILGASGGAKAIASLITYPHEVVRTRLRQPPIDGVNKYKSLWQTLTLIVREEGVASLYGGLTAHMLRVVPNAACMFLIYELVAQKLA